MFGEVLVMFDVFGGVVNIFIGWIVEVVFWLVLYMDVNVIDFVGVVDVEGLSWGDFEVVVVDNVKCVLCPVGDGLDVVEFDWCVDFGFLWICVFLEIKIVWYFKGM